MLSSFDKESMDDYLMKKSIDKGFEELSNNKGYIIYYINNIIHFPLIQSWYKDRKRKGWVEMPRHFFPEIGFIIYDKKTDKYLYAGWLYQSDSSVSVLDWIVGNPKHKNKEALEKLIESICIYAERQGYKYVFSIFDTKGLLLNKIFSSLKFRQSSKCDLYIKTL